MFGDIIGENADLYVNEKDTGTGTCPCGSGKDAEEFRRKHPKYPPELIGYRSEQFGKRSFRIEYV